MCSHRPLPTKTLRKSLPAEDPAQQNRYREHASHNLGWILDDFPRTAATLGGLQNTGQVCNGNGLSKDLGYSDKYNYYIHLRDAQRARQREVSYLPNPVKSSTVARI